MEEHNPRILVVDDERAIRRAIERALSGMTVSMASDGVEAAALLAKTHFDLVITDLRMPNADGFAVLAAAREHQPRTPAIMLTGTGSIADCVAAMRGGAANFISKPFQADQLRDAVLELLEPSHKSSEGSHRLSDDGVNLIGDRLEGVLSTVAQVAPHDATVLITGESGTGKELIARLVHATSGRSSNRYVAINCGAIPENLIESELFGHVKGAFTRATEGREGVFVRADGGTLFLDEIGDLPLSLQVKLVRVLQENEITPVGSSRSRRVDARIVAATLRDIEAMVEKGDFREDLYYRLNVIPIELPALRELPSDIPLLAEYFVERANRRYEKACSLAASTLAVLQSYDWPGNVRQLENLVERLVLTASTGRITQDSLPKKIRDATSLLVIQGARALDQDLTTAGVDLPRLLAEFEERIISEALEMTGGNKTRAATLLNVSRTTLLDKLKRMNS